MNSLPGEVVARVQTRVIRLKPSYTPVTVKVTGQSIMLR